MNYILILGGAGFIGSNLAEYFVKANKKVIVFDRKEAKWENLKSFENKIKVIHGDFNSPEVLENIFNENKIDLVIHLVSTITPGTTIDSAIENIELISTMKLIEIMNKKNVNKIIYFSSGGVIYGDNGKTINSEIDQAKPINFYGWLKLSMENYIQLCKNVYGLNYIILRPSNAYGKRQNICANQGLIAVTLGKVIQNKEIEIWGNGETVRDYININDLCRSTLLLLKKNEWNKIYNVGSGIGTSVNEVLDIVKKVTNVNLNIVYKKNRKVDIPINILNISKIKNDTGWNNLTELETGIKNMWEEINDK